MERAWPSAAKILTGFFVTALYAMPQSYTVSAKPGVVNYIEGNVAINGSALSSASLKTTFLNANDVLSTTTGKAEVLLAPGVFLRLGDNSEVRMVAPSLTDTQIELKRGEAMVEADDIVKDSRLTVLAGGGTVLVDRNGLYKFVAGDEAKAAVLEGKAQVLNGDRKLDVGKGKEVLLGATEKPKKFDAKKQDDLYAWSTVRAQYNAAASYQAAREMNASAYGGVWGGYGFSGFSNPGWVWNAGFNTWSWLPGDSAFYSPFGFGFYGPGVVGYAPVMYAPIYGGGRYWNGGQQASNGGGGGGASKTVTKPVPVNPVRPPAAAGAIAASPAANAAARQAAMRSFSSNGGFRTSNGATVPAGRAAAASSPVGARAAGGGAYAGPRGGGGYSGARSMGAAGGRTAGPAPSTSMGTPGGAHGSAGASAPAHR
ncbi:MAG TPA: FecR domain-containing protein [Bryobacteraceae bacterium]|jgi:hypothetical protein